ncbi:MAG: zinc-ribbon domain-containing protein [Candidatus Kariarchaeaceae archaeon]|jgi:hypothetical protein
MAHTVHAHHDANSPNYHSHVISVKGFDFCSGCFSSKLFLTGILPVLLFFFIYPNFLLDRTIDWMIIGLLWTTSTAVFSYELFTGDEIKQTVIRSLANTYLLGSILFVALTPSWLDSRTSQMLILVLILPQIGIFFYKILTKSEFTQVKLKITSRVMFITGFFFSLVNLTDSILLHVTIIGLGSFVFIKLRRFSSYRADPTKKLFSTVNLRGESFLARKIKKLGLFSVDGELDTGVLHQTSQLTKMKFFLLVGFLYSVNLLLVSSNPNVIHQCANDLPQSAIAPIPWLMMSTGSKKFCESCGSSLEPNDKFCLNCGAQIQVMQQPSYQQQQPYQSQNQGYQQSSYQPYGSPRRQRSKGQAYTIPVIVGVFVAIVATAATGSIFFGIFIGAVAGGGALLIMSVSAGNPCLGYCMADACCDCICSAINAESRRR